MDIRRFFGRRRFVARAQQRTAQALPRHSVAVIGVVVGSDGRVLATRRRDNGIWEPPGGVLELEETITDGLRREVYEETGLLVEPGALTGVYKNLARGIVALVFRCRPVGGDTHPTDEVSEIAWLRQEEIDGYMTEVYAIRVHDALCPDGPFVREHDGARLIGVEGDDGGRPGAPPRRPD